MGRSTLLIVSKAVCDLLISKTPDFESDNESDCADNNYLSRINLLKTIAISHNIRNSHIRISG